MNYESIFNAIDNILRNEASASDAMIKLNMQPSQVRDFYLNMQQMLYNG